MIRNSRHKGLANLYFEESVRGINPFHAKRLRQILALLDSAITVDDMNTPGLRLLNGRAGISPEMALRLSQAFGRSPESWLQLQNQYDLARVLASIGELNVKRFAA